jgi:hypothetical protein
MTTCEKNEIVTVNFDGLFGFSRFFSVFRERNPWGAARKANVRMEGGKHRTTNIQWEDSRM